MHSSKFLWHQEAAHRVAVAAAVDRAPARDDRATADDPTAFDQSLPVPWEWWPSAPTAK